MSEQNFWFFRLGERKTWSYEYLYARYSIISISFDIGSDLSGKNENDIGDYLRSQREGDKRKDTDQVNMFINEMQKGDIAVLQIRPEGVGKADYEYEIAMIIGGYQPLENIHIFKQKNFEASRRPARLVAPMAKRLKKKDFAGAELLFPMLTLGEIKSDDVKERVFELLRERV